MPVLLELLGRRVSVDAGGHLATAQVETLWSRCRPGVPVSEYDEPPAVLALPGSDRPLAPDAVVDLMDLLRLEAVTGAQDRLLLLRTAAVASPGGAVLGLVAASARLRVEAAAELSRRGFGYVTDEFLALDEAFDVVAFPEPLAFDQTDEDVASLAGPDALGMRSCPSQLHLVAMVVLEQDDARQGRPELVRAGRPADVAYLQGAVVAAPETWAVTALPDLIDEAGGVWILRYAAMHQAAPLLAELIVERTRPVSGPVELYVAVGIGEERYPRTPPARSPAHLLASGHDLALDGLRRTVWQAAAGGATLEALHTAANLELGGPHHVSVQLVAAAVRDLMGLGLLVPETGGAHPDHLVLELFSGSTH